MEITTTVKRWGFAVAGICAGITLAILALQAAGYDERVNAYRGAMGVGTDPVPLLHGMPWGLFLIAGIAIVAASAVHPFDTSGDQG